MRDSLFEAPIVETSRPRPLADRLRPAALDEIIGQSHLFGEGGALALERLMEHLP